MSSDDLISALGVIGRVYPHFSYTIGKAIDEISKSEISDVEKEIFQSLFNGWVQADMLLPGNISYQMVFDLMKKIGVDPSEGEKKLAYYDKP
jgi:hypothetical protein